MKRILFRIPLPCHLILIIISAKVQECSSVNMDMISPGTSCAEFLIGIENMGSSKSGNSDISSIVSIYSGSPTLPQALRWVFWKVGYYNI